MDWENAKYSILLRIPWLLPHDMSYLGLPAIVEAFKRAAPA